MASVKDSEGFISMLEGTDTSPPVPVPQSKLSVDCPDFDLVDVSEPSNGKQRKAVDPDAEWGDDAVPTKLEKIRAAFLNSKTAAEVTAAAGNMPVSMWLECVIKLMPKDIKVQGEVSFRHMLEGLGPIDKDAYRLGAPRDSARVVEAEFVELTEFKLED